MIKYSVGFFLMMCILAIISISCNRNKVRMDETPTRGEISILVDETFFPMIDDQIVVFEHQYKYAKFNMITLPEQEILSSLLKDTSRVAIMSRELSSKELAYFSKRKLIPQVTDLAYDAIALIVNTKNRDSILSLRRLEDMLNAKDTVMKLVFDNSKSSTIQCILGEMKMERLSEARIYSTNSNEEVIRYIAEHDTSIGFVGINWLYQPTKEQQVYVNKVKVLGIGKDSKFVKPSQETIANEEYPFIRKIRLINCQGRTGLGKGLASFIAGDQGQRIILKSGLVPINFPKREIVIRKK